MQWKIGVLLVLFCSLALGQEIAVTSRHAPNINGEGHVEGSIQMLLGENAALNGGAEVEGDFYVPGAPSVQINGTPTFGGVLPGAGSLQPDGYSVTLHTGISLQYLRTRSISAALPVVAPSQATSGTRNVTVNQASAVPADWGTVRDLTVNSGAGSVQVPPGAYRNITANGQSALRVGIAGATSPAVYNIQSLTLNGQAQIIVEGPVILALNSGLNLNGTSGVAAHPEWLQARLASGGVTLNGGATFYGMILAPAGTVTINGGASLYGTVACDRFRLNGQGLVSWRGAQTGGNHAPVAQTQSVTTNEDGLVAITLFGSDADNDTLTYAVATVPAHGQLTGVGSTWQYKPDANFNGTDSFTFVANDGQGTSSPAVVNIIVTPVNDAPVPREQSVLVTEDQPMVISLTATDAEGDALVFFVPDRTVHGRLEKYTAPGAGTGDFLYIPTRTTPSQTNFHSRSLIRRAQPDRLRSRLPWFRCKTGRRRRR